MHKYVIINITYPLERRNEMQSISYKVALGGIISSLCLLCMFLTGVIPVMYIVLPMIAGILMMIIAIEVDTKWAFLTYLSTSILSMIITFDKESALLYILLFGHYPIIKKYIDTIKPRIIRIITKTTIFNTSILLTAFLTIHLLGMTEFYDELLKKGPVIVAVILAVMNFICAAYDISLEGIFQNYCRSLKPRLKHY